MQHDAKFLNNTPKTKHKKMAYELTPKDIIDQYSLATSGKQSKIEVIAQTCYMTHRYMDDNKNTMKGY